MDPHQRRGEAVKADQAPYALGRLGAGLGGSGDFWVVCGLSEADQGNRALMGIHI